MDDCLIVVCGDSFLAASQYDRYHFSDILQDRYGYSVVNLARGGVSMVCIGMQLKTAIELKPWAIIHSNTGPYRLDIPVNNKKFRRPLGLKDFIYYSRTERSTGNKFVGNRESTIMSDVIENFLPDSDTNFWYPDVTPDQRQAMKQYFMHLFDSELKTEIDLWIHEYWIMKMQAQGIFSVVMSPEGIGKVAYDFGREHPHHNVLYHTDPDTQVKVAEEIAEILGRLQEK